MAGKRPSTIAEYIEAAPPEGQAHLRQLHALLKRVAPRAQEAIKWGAPFFIEPRFLFSFNACKAHLNFAPSLQTMDAFRKELASQRTTKHFLQVRYDEPLPVDLIRRMAKHQLQLVRARETDNFW